MTFPRLVVGALALLAPLANTAPAPVTPVRREDTLRFNFGSEKVRGVNLGGWFVLEPWITPSIFESTPANVVDEYTFCQTLGTQEAEQRLQAHWSTWITEADFPVIKGYGINLVRIPIGYWSVAPIQGEPYVQGAYDYLSKAIQWAGNNGIGVMIDLHGAPGSQNGFDNSGRRGGITWSQGDTIAQSHTALNKIRDDHASNPAVVAIELINEPFGPSLNMDTVRQYYYDGWGNLQGSNVAITFHDAFQDVTSWNDFGAGMWALLEDTHHYEVFSGAQLAMNPSQHVNSACAFGASMATTNKWTIAGEWAGAMTDCALWLNGRGVGARYDGTYNYNGQTSSYIGDCAGKTTGTVDALSAADRTDIKNFINAQIVAYEKAAGWIFWTWKNEAAPEWHFANLTAAGLVPQPLDSADASLCG